MGTNEPRDAIEDDLRADLQAAMIAGVFSIGMFAIIILCAYTLRSEASALLAGLAGVCGLGCGAFLVIGSRAFHRARATRRVLGRWPAWRRLVWAAAALEPEPLPSNPSGPGRLPPSHGEARGGPDPLLLAPAAARAAAALASLPFAPRTEPTCLDSGEVSTVRRHDVRELVLEAFQEAGEEHARGETIPCSPPDSANDFRALAPEEAGALIAEGVAGLFYGAAATAAREAGADTHAAGLILSAQWRVGMAAASHGLRAAMLALEVPAMSRELGKPIEESPPTQRSAG